MKWFLITALLIFSISYYNFEQKNLSERFICSVSILNARNGPIFPGFKGINHNRIVWKNCTIVEVIHLHDPDKIFEEMISNDIK